MKTFINVYYSYGICSGFWGLHPWNFNPLGDGAPHPPCPPYLQTQARLLCTLFLHPVMENERKGKVFHELRWKLSIDSRCNDMTAGLCNAVGTGISRDK